MHLAVLAQKEELCEGLLKLKADPNVKNLKGRHTLHVSSHYLNSKIIRMLLAASTSLQTRDEVGLTPMASCQLWHSAKHCVELYGKADAYSHKLIQAKWVAHSLEISTSLSIEGSTVDLLGASSGSWTDEMGNSLKKFSLSYPEHLSLEEQRAALSLLEFAGTPSRNQAEYLLENFQKNIPIFIETGSSTHSVGIIFTQTHLVIANKGKGSRRPLEIYQIDPALVTLGVFKELLKLQRAPIESYLEWLSQSSLKLQLKQSSLENLIESAYPFALKQLVGNCSWASLETALYAFIALQRTSSHLTEEENLALLSRLNSSFKQWVRFTQVEALEQFKPLASTFGDELFLSQGFERQKSLK